MAPQKRDYYEVLGISRSANESEIKKAYRKLAMKFHPDNAKRKKLNETEIKNYEEKFKEIGEAYSVLSDSDKKSNYDTFGHEGLSGGRRGAPGGFGGIKFDFGGNDAFDIFSQFFGGGFGDISGGQTRQKRTQGGFGGNPFGGGFTGQQPQQPTPKKGDNITIPIKIGEDEALVGITKKITMTINKEGRNEKETIKVKVPPNVKNGVKLRIKNKGKPGKHGGEFGDLFVKIKIVPTEPQSQIFRINLFQALIGTEIEIETPSGIVKHTIESGVQNGEIINLPKKGNFIGNSKIRKDLNVELRIVLPRLQTMEQKEIVKQLAKALGMNF